MKRTQNKGTKGTKGPKGPKGRKGPKGQKRQKGQKDIFCDCIYHLCTSLKSFCPFRPLGPFRP